MIGAFLVNRIPTCFAVEIATGGVAADKGEDGRQDKGPRCAFRSDGENARVSEAISRCARILRDVRHRHFLHFSDGSCTSGGKGHEPR
jgi:hypothetical protein